MIDEVRPIHLAQITTARKKATSWHFVINPLLHEESINHLDEPYSGSRIARIFVLKCAPILLSSIAMLSIKVPSERPPKRMRLGTKSCAECRRRKVRCIYPPNSRICKDCIRHDVVCVPQTAAQQSGHLTPESQDDEKSMRERLEELEGMVRLLCRAADVKLDPLDSERLEINADALSRLRRASTPEPKSVSSSYRASSTDNSELDTPNGTSNLTGSFEDAPLLHLFKAAMMLEGDATYGESSRTGLTVQHRIQACIKSLDALIPSSEDLTSILQATERYWPLWHAFPMDVLSSEARRESVANVRHFIFDSVRSNNPAVVAKALLCLALCVQQLPVHFKVDRPNLPASPSALVDSYMVGAETLLPVNESSAGNIDDLECFILQAKLYLNMGKPRNAWLCMRRALSFAMLQGLHKLDGNERQTEIWNHIWQHDRNLSLILGLPSAVADTHPSVRRPPNSKSTQGVVLYDFSIIAGHINDRNQNQQEVDYSATEYIERELQQYGKAAGWNLLNTEAHASMPLQVIYELQMGKLFYYNLCMMVHLPYMLKSKLDQKYEHNRLATLSAARDMTNAWQQLRDCSGSENLIICDLMDFQVFTAALVIVINLLSESCRDPIHQQASDWERVQDFTKNLQYLNGQMECKVAGQAAKLLEYLSAVHQGTYDGPEIYQAVIPYFGKVRISQMRKVTPFSADAKFGGGVEQDISSNMVEFNTDSFVPFSQNYMGDYLSEEELGVDWTAVLNADIGYEWSQSFQSSSFGVS